MTTLTGFSVLFPQLYGKCQGKTRKNGARPALFLIFGCYVYFLCCSMYFCVVLCIVCFVSFSVLFMCMCVLNYCHRVATQLQLNIYHIILSPVVWIISRALRGISQRWYIIIWHCTKKVTDLSPHKCLGFAGETILSSFPNQNFKQPPCGCHLWSQIVKVQIRGDLAPNGTVTISLTEIRHMVGTLLGNHIYTEGHRHDQ